MPPISYTNYAPVANRMRTIKTCKCPICDKDIQIYTNTPQTKNEGTDEIVYTVKCQTCGRVLFIPDSKTQQIETPVSDYCTIDGTQLNYYNITYGGADVKTITSSADYVSTIYSSEPDILKEFVEWLKKKYDTHKVIFFNEIDKDLKEFLEKN